MKNRIRNSENRIRNSDQELMQQALGALESVFEGEDKGAEYWTVTGGIYEAVECMNAMRALRARLAQPEPQEIKIEFKEWLHPSMGVVPVDPKTPLILKAVIREKL